MKRFLFIPLLAVFALAAFASPAMAAKHAASAAGDKGSLTASTSVGVTTLTGCGYQHGYAATITVTDSTGASQSAVATDAGQNCVSASFTLAPGDYSARATQDVNGGLDRINYPWLFFTVA
jgi:uncharacterized protein (DUF2141 family)